MCLTTKLQVQASRAHHLLFGNSPEPNSFTCAQITNLGLRKRAPSNKPSAELAVPQSWVQHHNPFLSK
ncbi:hypothetical protein AMECASPLE_034663 [Ameca splendens]|uniref:Uncharacterized protein n=1 Tax=Ameca splendens TaxID=208324 RepID=A0ABV0ZIF1_9TELE